MERKMILLREGLAVGTIDEGHQKWNIILSVNQTFVHGMLWDGTLFFFRLHDDLSSFFIRVEDIK
jgi:hypothetical protein